MRNVDIESPDEPLFKKGQRFVCWECRKEIGYLARDVYAGEAITESMFEWCGHPYVNGERPVCYSCKAGIFDSSNYLNIDGHKHDGRFQ